MCFGSLLGEFNDAADLHIFLRIIRIHNGESYFRVGFEIAVFGSSMGGIEQDVLTVRIEPDTSKPLGITVATQQKALVSSLSKY